jgi:hypothetical protein
MKNILFIISLLSSILFFSQERKISYGTYRGSGNLRYHSTTNDVEGSNYLFKDWNNTNVIFFTNQNLSFNTLNINIVNNTFERLVSDTQCFVFDLKFIKYAIINNKKYQYFYSENDAKERIFEVIAESKKVKILKGFMQVFEKGKPNLIDTDPVDKYVLQTKYYLKKGDKIERFKLRKRKILALLEDKKDEIVKFVKKNKLSYKNEDNLKMIFNYYNSL